MAKRRRLLTDELTGEPDPLPQLVFFLGAGASKPAGVPLTLGFVETLRASLRDEDATRGQDSQLAVAYDVLVTYLKRNTRDGRLVDIELVYETLLRLADPEDDVLLASADELPVSAEVAAELKGLAERHIREKAFVAPAKTAYLDEIVALRGRGPLTVFSTNYDTCIEVLCERHRLRWEDGFRVRWEPRVFREKGIDVRLHKLHGSVLWYRDQIGSYLRSPLRPNGEAAGGVPWFGGVCEPLLIYPARKSAQDAPYAYGLLKLADTIGSQPRPVQLVVVGYSFRDEHLRQIVMDAAVANPDLHVVLVSPSASAIYEEQLRGTGDAPSPLADRVFCVDEGFDDDGALLRSLVRWDLHNAAEAFKKERALTLHPSTAHEYAELASSYAWVGDRHGHARCVERMRSRGDEVTPKQDLAHRITSACLAARSSCRPAEFCRAVDDLCGYLRDQFGRVTRPAGGQEGNGFENWSFNVRLAITKADLQDVLRDGIRLSEALAERGGPERAKRAAAAADWLRWLESFTESVHTTKGGTAHLSFPELLRFEALQSQPTETEYRSDAMTAHVESALDRFFTDVAPARLLARLRSGSAEAAAAEPSAVQEPTAGIS